MFVVDLFHAVDPGDRAYFRKSREARLGCSLEDAQADREERLPAFHKLLAPIRSTLSNQPWLGGDEPSYADHLVAAAFMWPSSVCCFNLLPPDGPMQEWWRRVQAQYESLAAKAVRRRCHAPH